MSEISDKRITFTKRTFKDSLIQLLNTKNVNDISVTELCKKAGICRSTFYYHYDSVYDLYLNCVDEVKDDINEIIMEAYGDGKYSEAKTLIMYENIFHYAEGNRGVFLALLGEKNGMRIGEEYCNFLGRFGNAEELSRTQLYCQNFIASGLTTVLWLWLNDENRSPVHDVAMTVYRMTIHGAAVLNEEFDNAFK